jgi:hypothetical protein
MPRQCCGVASPLQRSFSGQKTMFVFLPPTFVDFSCKFVNIILGRLALGNNFFVAEIVQKSLNLFDINIRWQFYDDGLCRAFDGHDNNLVRPQRYWQIGDYPSQKWDFAGKCPQRCAKKPVSNFQKPLKTNIISMSRRHHAGLSAKNGSGIFRADALNCPPLQNPKKSLKVNILYIRHHARLPLLLVPT